MILKGAVLNNVTDDLGQCMFSLVVKQTASTDAVHRSYKLAVKDEMCVALGCAAAFLGLPDMGGTNLNFRGRVGEIGRFGARYRRKRHYTRQRYGEDLHGSRQGQGHREISWKTRKLGRRSLCSIPSGSNESPGNGVNREAPSSARGWSESSRGGRRVFGRR